MCRVLAALVTLSFLLLGACTDPYGIDGSGFERGIDADILATHDGGVPPYATLAGAIPRRCLSVVLCDRAPVADHAKADEMKPNFKPVPKESSRPLTQQEKTRLDFIKATRAMALVLTLSWFAQPAAAFTDKDRLLSAI